MNYKRLNRILGSALKISDGSNPALSYKDPRFGDDNKDYRKLLSAIKSAARKCGGWLESWNYDAGWTAYFPDEASADKYAELCASFGFPAFGKRRTGESEIEVILEGSWGPDSYVDRYLSETYTLYNGEKSHESNLPEQNVVVRNLMLQDLKKKLDSGKVLRFVGADHPGLDVIYCSKDKLEEAFQDFKDDYDLEGETIDELCEEVGVDPSHKYFRIAFDLKGFGDWFSSSGDTVEDLDPEMDACIELLETALKEGKITKDQIEFCDDNDDAPFADLGI